MRSCVIICDHFRMIARSSRISQAGPDRSPAKRRLSKLYLQNANHPIGLVDDYCNLNSLGLGIVDEMLLNQLLGKRLRALEFKVREELNGGELIANYTIKRLSVHSLGVRVNVNRVVRACKTVEALSLLNCLLTQETAGMLIENDCLRTLDIQNDYWDDDIESGRLIARCFSLCSHLTVGRFNNVNLKAFHPAICSLAARDPNKVYRLYLDDVPENEAFGRAEWSSASNPPALPANLLIFELQRNHGF